MGVVQRVLEEPPHVASCLTDSETASPCVFICILSQLSEARRSSCERVENLVGIGVAIHGSRGLDGFVADRRERRLRPSERLLNAVGVEPRDVTTVRGVLDRRPRAWLRSGAQTFAGDRELFPPSIAEQPQAVEQRSVAVSATVEPARLAALMDSRHGTSLLYRSSRSRTSGSPAQAGRLRVTRELRATEPSEIACCRAVSWSDRCRSARASCLAQSDRVPPAAQARPVMVKGGEPSSSWQPSRTVFRRLGGSDARYAPAGPTPVV